MREDDGRKLDHQTLEALRLRATEQVARQGSCKVVNVLVGMPVEAPVRPR
jgi:hypothetical protein